MRIYLRRALTVDANSTSNVLGSQGRLRPILSSEDWTCEFLQENVSRLSKVCAPNVAPPQGRGSVAPAPLGRRCDRWPLHTGLTPTRKSYRDSCWQFGCKGLTGLGWLRNHVKVMGEREILNKSNKFSWIWTPFNGWDDTKWKWREKNKCQGANNGKKE